MIQFNKQKEIAFIGSFHPRRCGIATFTLYLIQHTNRASERVFKPVVIAMQSDSYKNKLHNLVVALKLENNAIFHDEFVTETELRNFFAAADMYITPYLNKEQLTSGTLAFAVGCGKAVVSTPYWVAEELFI